VRVALTVAPDDTRIEERPDPSCGPGDVVCRVLACATCGSDVGWYVRRKLPAVLGHEPVGQVVEVGADVTGVAVGDRVAIHHHAPCGECRRCRHGHETLCEQFRATALDPGGFAEYVRIGPELVGELLPLDGLDVVDATLVEPLGCALRAQDRAGIRPGDSLLVVGAGCSGMLHVAAAHARGVDAVWVREPDHERLARAERWGATAHGNEPVDVAIVCTESPRAIADAAQALAPGGTLCLYAPPEPGSALGVDGWTVFERELRVTASWSAGPADMRAALALLQAGAAPVVELLEWPFSLADTGAALDAQRSGAVYKAVVFP
jgi:L-iditol 2-dehydrogenase